MSIKTDNIINSWDIYSATQFEKDFNIKEKWDAEETDEEFIYRHLEKDKRKFKVNFMESARCNHYEEFWRIEEVEE